MGWDAPRDPSCLAESTEVPDCAGILEKNLALPHSCVPSISNQAVKTFQGNTRSSIPRKRDGKPAWETPARHQPGGATEAAQRGQP